MDQHKTPPTTGNKLTANECICCLKVKNMEMNVSAGLWDCVLLSVQLVKYVINQWTSFNKTFIRYSLDAHLNVFDVWR